MLCTLRTEAVVLEIELLEGRVRLERLGEVLGALRTEVVGPEPASEGEIRVSAAIDSGEEGVR